jgi:L-lactate dehydrogenase complex protein LldG
VVSDERSSKEKILKKVRKGLLQKGDPYTTNLDLDTDVYVKEVGELIETFSGNFHANKGEFAYCFNEYDFVDQFLGLVEERHWKSVISLEKHFQSLFAHCNYNLFVKKDEVRIADVGLTGCDALVARTGSVVLSSKENLSRTLSIFPPVHAVVAYRGSVVYDLKNYFSALNTIDIQSLPSMISIVSGPSRTADIEKTLVLGAHGPKEIHVFYIDQEKRF